MNRILLFPDHPQQNEFVISDPQVVNHIKEHLKAKKGDTLKVCLVNEGLGMAQVTNLSPLTLNIQFSLAGTSGQYHVEVGACRPPSLKKIVEHGTTLGVKSFHFFPAALSEKSFLTSKVLMEQSLRQLWQAGLSQSSDLFCAPEFPTEPIRASQRFLLTFNSQKTFMDYSLDFSEDISLAIGPERGWTEKEEEAYLNEFNFCPVTITSHNLRVENALFVALGQLEMLRLKSYSKTL